MSLKPFLAAVIVLLLLASSVEAGLSAPTTNSIGYKIWGKYWDLMGENGLRNGTLGGVGNNVTFLDGSGITFLPISGTTSDLDMNGKNITNVRVVNSTSAAGISQAQVNNSINWFLPRVSNPTIQTFSTINNVSLISTDNLSTYTERDTGSFITVTDTRVQLTGVQGQAINVYKNVSETGNFEYIFSFYASSMTPSSAAIMHFSNTTSNPNVAGTWGVAGVGTGFGFFWSSELVFRLEKYVGDDGSNTGDTNIPFLINTKYYMKLNRTGTTLRLNVYSDVERTTEIAGSPLSYTVGGDTFTVISLTAVYTAYNGVQSMYIENFGENLMTNTTFNPIANNSNTYYKSIRLNITNETNQYVNLSIYGNANNYQTALTNTNFTVSQQDPRIVFYRTYNPNPLADYSTTLTATQNAQTEYNMTVKGGMPALSGGEHGTILATEVGVGSILQLEQSKLGTFADNTLLTEGTDFYSDMSNKTTTNITLTSGVGIVAGTSKLRISWLADIMNANSSSPNTAITVRVNMTRNNINNPLPEILPVAPGKYVEFIRSW